MGQSRLKRLHHTQGKPLVLAHRKDPRSRTCVNLPWTKRKANISVPALSRQVIALPAATPLSLPLIQPQSCVALLTKAKRLVDHCHPLVSLPTWARTLRAESRHHRLLRCRRRHLRSSARILLRSRHRVLRKHRWLPELLFHLHHRLPRVPMPARYSMPQLEAVEFLECHRASQTSSRTGRSCSAPARRLSMAMQSLVLRVVRSVRRKRAPSRCLPSSLPKYHAHLVRLLLREAILRLRAHP